MRNEGREGGRTFGLWNPQKNMMFLFWLGDPLEAYVNTINSPKLLQDFMGLNGSGFLMGLEIRYNSFPVAEFVWSKGPEAQQYPKHPSRATEDPKWHMMS